MSFLHAAWASRSTDMPGSNGSAAKLTVTSLQNPLALRQYGNCDGFATRPSGYWSDVFLG
eukprot:2415085-Rhodomonas_salina.1